MNVPRTSQLGLSITAGMLMASVVNAAPINTLDAQDFAYVWNFDGVDTPANYDRYDSTTGASASDGVFEYTPQTAPVGGVVTRTDASFAGTFWNSAAIAASQINTATGYTVETRVRMTTSGTTGRLLAIEASLPGTTGVITGSVVGAAPGMIDLYFRFPASNLETFTKIASVAAPEFFSVRIAATPDANMTGGLSYSLYVNDALVGDGLGPASTGVATRRFFLGDIGGQSAGTIEIESIAFTPGAFAVPEPGSLALAGVGLACLALRRRR